MNPTPRGAALLTLLGLAATGFAAPTEYRFSGLIDSAITYGAWETPVENSVVGAELRPGTDFEVTFGYDPALAPISPDLGNFADYDLALPITGRIGGRRFSANAAYTLVFDGRTGADPRPDTLDFRIEPFAMMEGATPAVITEANPFVGSGYALRSIRVTLGKGDGSAFSSAALPGRIDLAAYDIGTAIFVYDLPATTSSNLDGRQTVVLGTVAAIAPVPEPATLAALGLGAAALLRRRRSIRSA